ncbi:hypothetical protein Tco_1290194 [Tanacetum coccineum]
MCSHDGFTLYTQALTFAKAIRHNKVIHHRVILDNKAILHKAIPHNKGIPPLAIMVSQDQIVWELASEVNAQKQHLATEMETLQLRMASLLDNGNKSLELLNEVMQGAPKKREGTPDGIKGRARFTFEESFDQNPNPEFICTSKHTHILHLCYVVKDSLAEHLHTGGAPQKVNVHTRGHTKGASVHLKEKHLVGFESEAAFAAALLGDNALC